MTNETGSGPPGSHSVSGASVEVQDLLFEGAPTRIYRARSIDGRPVILKSLRHRHDPAEAAAGIRHEHDIARDLPTEHVVKVYGIEQGDEHLSLVLEDFGGSSLDQIVRSRRLGIEEVLEIGIQVALGLAHIHAANVIHKDINPSNIVYNPETGVVKIIDFGISTYLTREQADMGSPSVLEGTLHYLSPEQTGRMNRALDYRSDFYSLGATLYELLANKPLFDVDEPIEWLHCHVAREPLPLHRVNATIPAVLSDIVAKLLAKAADERYRSATGIRADLERCLEEFRAAGAIRPFPLGECDRPERFQIPQRLYGRDAETARLMASFERASRGDAGLVLVAGYSGIGKTCLIKELYRPITSRRGFFISGKFDQLHRNVPLSAPISALRDLVRQLLTEPEAALESWRARIVNALGGNGRLITDLIPELHVIIGVQPGVPALPARAAERRFHRTLVNFMRVFCRREHPLVMFLDDLQWADAATLDVIEMLLTDSRIEHLLLIGACRDNEVYPGHPLERTLERLRKVAFLDELTLPPLSRRDLGQLLADALYVSEDAVLPLTKLVERKTGGNPYFIEEFLKDLYRRALIRYDPAATCWRWDLDAIETQHMTDNVVELMSEKLRRLSPGARHLLQLAACIGHRFELGMLLALCGNDWRSLFPDLREAMSQSLIAPIGYRCQRLVLETEPGPAERAMELAFAHDRIQQAAHELLGDDARRAAHLEIGRILITGLVTGTGREHLFRITDHLNIARPLIRTGAARHELRAWNRAAGRSAAKAAAYAAAYEYFMNAISLESDVCWTDDLDETLALHAEAADAACTTARYEACDKLINDALQHAPDHVAAGPLNQVRLASLVAQGLHTRALELGKELLEEFGRRYPAKPTRLHLLAEYLILQRKLARVSREHLHALPVNTDVAINRAYGIGEQVALAAQFAQPELLPLLVMRGIRVALASGVNERSINAFSGFGVQLCISRGNVTEGEKYSRFALELCDRFPQSSARGRIHVGHAAYVAPWSTPLADTLEPLAHAYELCLGCSDFDAAAQAAAYRISYCLASGMPLPEVDEEIRRWRPAVAALNQREAVHYIDSLHQLVLNLLDQAEDPAVLKGASYDIDVMMPEHERVAARRLIVSAAARQAILHGIFGQLPQALLRFDAIRSLLPATNIVFDGMYLQFHDALTRARTAHTERGWNRRKLLRQAEQGRRVVERWAKRAPANARAKLLLLDAERHRARGDERRAQRCYDQAIETAREHHLPHEEALASQLAAEMHLATGRRIIAEAYLRSARDAYWRWGAAAVVKHLEQRHRVLIAASAPRPRDASEVNAGADVMSGVDITALMKALKAIAEERVHSRMVRTIITTAMEFAGAQHALLMLRNDRQELKIEAEASVDRRDAQILQSVPVVSSRSLSHAVVNYVTRTRESVVVHDAQAPGGPIPGLHLDPHVQQERVCSILCLPIVASSGADDDQLIGLLYLENNRATHTFTEQRFDTLEIIGMAAAGRLELSRKAAVDGLTELFNRDYFQTMLHQEVLASQRHGRTVSLILADIDHFKRFNDTWGHPVGDEVLKAVAAAVRMTCRESDVVARFGGEEVAIILPGTDAAGSLALAERIRREVEAILIEHEGEALTVTLSLGVATLTADMTDDGALLRTADEALYEAKHAGRNRVRAA